MVPAHSLLQVLAGISPKPLTKQTVYRYVDLERLFFRATVPNFKLLYASTVASRYTFDQGPKRLYVSLNETTAREEYLQGTERSLGLPRNKFKKSWAVIWMDCSIRNVIDLNDRNVRTSLGVTLKELKLEWEPFVRDPLSITQTLGTAIYDSKRFSAVVFESARRSGKNVVLFPDRLKKGDYVRFHINAGRSAYSETLP